MTASRPTRGGYTLIEMVLAIGAVAIVLGLCGGLLHVLLRLDRSGRDHLVETATIGRVARQFRQDVHAAREAKVSGEAAAAAGLELALTEDRTIVYTMRDRALVRTEKRGDIAGRRESYALPFCRGGRFGVRNADSQVWVSLELLRGTGKDTGPMSLRHDLPIEALAARDHRWLTLRDPRTREADP
jgi:hypothetical protein